MKFKSKIDWWVHIVFAVIPLTALWIAIEFIRRPGSVGLMIGLSVLVICNVFMLPWWWNTHYILGTNDLIVKLGGFGAGTRIPYSSITSVKETRSPLASAALSLDRIEIKSKMITVLISPQNKKIFLSLLEDKRKERI